MATHGTTDPAEHTWHFFQSSSVLLSIGEQTRFQDEKYDLHISMTLTPARAAEEEKKKYVMLCGVSCVNVQQLLQKVRNSCQSDILNLPHEWVHCKLKQTTAKWIHSILYLTY